MANLFKDIAQVKAAVPSVSSQMNFTNFSAYVADAAARYVIPFISQEYYDELVTENTADSLSADNQKVFPDIQRALGYYALYDAYPFLNANVSDTGLSQHNPDHSMPLPQWKYKEGRREAINKADALLDKALKYMDENPDDFATWQATDVFTRLKDLFITNARDFSEQFDISESRRTFLKLKPYMELVEERYIKPTIGVTLYDALKARLLAGTNTPADDNLLDKWNGKLLKALAWLTIYEGSQDLRFNVSAVGVHLVSTDDGITGWEPNSEQFDKWRHEKKGKADGYLADLKTYLEANEATYPEYESDDAADSDFPATTFRDQSGGKSVMV